MAKDKIVHCPVNAGVSHGRVGDLICGPWCPHYAQARKLSEDINLKNRRARKAVQDTSRNNGRFPNCPNPWK